jgi:hypothetical protein
MKVKDVHRILTSTILNDKFQYRKEMISYPRICKVNDIIGYIDIDIDIYLFN